MADPVRVFLRTCTLSLPEHTRGRRVWNRPKTAVPRISFTPASKSPEPPPHESVACLLLGGEGPHVLTSRLVFVVRLTHSRKGPVTLGVVDVV